MISIRSLESPIHCPGEQAGDQKDEHEHKVNAFDLLFIDCSQHMVNGWPLTKDADDVAGFKHGDADEPKDHKDPTSHRDAFSICVGHSPDGKSEIVNRKWRASGEMAAGGSKRPFRRQ
jgi:hypothetical protein